jgi:hypothetical protein
VLEIQGFASSCLQWPLYINIHYLFFQKITICVNRWYICIYTIDLILLGNVDENLVVFDDFQIITFNTFYFSLYSMRLFSNKEQNLIHVHSRNLMHYVLVHVSHQAHVCHCWIEFGSINIFLLFNYLTTFASQHHRPFTHAKLFFGLLSPLATSLLLKRCGIVKNFSHFVWGHIVPIAAYSSSYCDTLTLCFKSSFIPLWA